eukprot:1157634-Pelagomonas_calceolata.AAC.10
MTFTTVSRSAASWGKNFTCSAFTVPTLNDRLAPAFLVSAHKDSSSARFPFGEFCLHGAPQAKHSQLSHQAMPGPPLFCARTRMCVYVRAKTQTHHSLVAPNSDKDVEQACKGEHAPHRRAVHAVLRLLCCVTTPAGVCMQIHCLLA